jgi:hypothetical protein
MLLRFAFIAICFVFVTHSAVADNRVVFPTVNALTLNAGGAMPPPYVTVSCYYIGTVCSGGGDFDVGPACGAGNNATEVVDASGNCYYRKNFGVSGIVDARQCGVVGDGRPASGITGRPDDATLLNNCITYASGVGYHIVTTGGGVILDNTTDIMVKDNITLTCGGGSISGAANNDYRLFVNESLNLSKAIVLDPTAGGVGYTVRVSGRNAHYEGCTEVAGAGPTGAENPYSPSTWFPDCPPTDTVADCATVPGGATTYLRSAELEASAFNPNPTAKYPTGGPASHSVGVSVEAPGAVIRDVTVLGFGRCIAFGTSGGDGEHAPGPTMERVNGDCNTGVTVWHSDVPFFSKLKIDPSLTDAFYRVWTILNMQDDGTGKYKVTSRIEDQGSDTTFRLQDGDTVWIGTGHGGGQESARGRWLSIP